MSTNEAKPSVLKFALIEGGLRGAWRGFLLSELYALLFTALFTGLILLENDGTYNPFGFALVALFYGQMIGVLPSVVIGFISGAVIARFTIALSDRAPAVAGRLAAAIALSITLLIDGYLIVLDDVPLLAFYFYFGVPSLIFVFDATRTTRKQLPKVEAFASGSLKPRAVNIFFWLAVLLKLSVFAISFRFS